MAKDSTMLVQVRDNEEWLDDSRPLDTRPTAEPRIHRIVEVNPFRCRIWSFHDRLDDYVTEHSCRSEIQSFKKHGQLVPALARPVHDSSNYDVEIIYGARRLFVARHLNVPLHVELRELSDREAVVAMDIENRQRKDISPYERGLNYARWLRAKHFESQDEIARVLKISPSQICRLLKLAQLPSVLVNAFASPLDIREGWGSELLKRWEDPKTRAIMAERARAVVNQRPRAIAHEVYQQLLAPSGMGRRALRPCHDTVVSGGDGRPLFRIRHQSGTVALLLPSKLLSKNSLDSISQAVCNLLDGVPAS